MGFYIRKSLRVGPLRFNLSKSGIGVSAGVRGFRVGSGPRGNYVHIGRGGLYYRQTLPLSPSAPTDDGMPDATIDENDSATHGPMMTVASGCVSQMVDSSSARLLSEIKEKGQRISWWSGAVALSVVTVIGLFASGVPPWIVVLVGTLAAVGVVCAGVRDTLAKSVVIMYQLDEYASGAFEQLHDSVLQLAQCGAAWHVDSQGRVHDPKYHAGASNLVSRRRIAVGPYDPPHVKTNVPIVRIPSGGRSLYFLPDCLLVYGNGGVGAVAYADVRFSISGTRFIEEESVPADAKVVDHTWRYVNKDGGPDRRFNDNRQLPICSYEEIHFHSDSGLNELIQVSRCGLGANLERVVHAMAQAIEVARSAQLDRKRGEEERQVCQQGDATTDGKDAQVDQAAERSDSNEELLNKVHLTLLRVLCCVMVADGRASRSERDRIHRLMQKVKAPWDAESLDNRINAFIEEARLRGFNKVLEETLQQAKVFTQIGKESVLLRCVDAIVGADEAVDERERAVRDRIRQMVTGQETVSGGSLHNT